MEQLMINPSTSVADLRWLPVYVHDLTQLPTKHPELYAEFRKGKFVVQKSEKKFSLMAKDQSHEQLNKALQAHGGALGLYDNQEALDLYMMSAPDSARIIDEFESALKLKDESNSNYTHHEEAPYLQKKFTKDVSSFVNLLTGSKNPFHCGNLMTLDSRQEMSTEVTTSLSSVRSKGQTMHNTYVKTVLEETSEPITNTIKPKNILTFSNQPTSKIKAPTPARTYKNNMALVTRMFMSLHNRPGSDMYEFFKYENQKEPPSLAEKSMPRTGNKAEILECLDVPKAKPQDIPNVSMLVLDMPAMVRMLPPEKSKKFSEYVSEDLAPALKKIAPASVTRMDFVWDTYPEQDNLKALTHAR